MLSTTPQEIEEQLIQFARKHSVPCMSGATENRLVQYLMTWKPVMLLEIGSAIGYSTGRFARICAERQGYVTSFEISHPSHMIALRYLFMQSITNATIYHIHILQAPLERLSTHLFDFVFIDGAKQEYDAYFRYVLPYCAPGATIVCDDVLMYADKIAPLYDTLHEHALPYTIHQLDTDDGICVITIPSHEN